MLEVSLLVNSEKYSHFFMVTLTPLADPFASGFSEQRTYLLFCQPRPYSELSYEPGTRMPRDSFHPSTYFVLEEQRWVQADQVLWCWAPATGARGLGAAVSALRFPSRFSRALTCSRSYPL